MKQSELPYHGLPPMQVESETSVEAALSVEPTAETLRAKLLAWLRKRGALGATDHEMQAEMPMAPNTQRPRRRELQLRGLVTDSGIKRLTPSGRKAVVWVAA